MAKGAGRKTADKASKPSREAAVAASLSPEEAERAAAAFVPLWQFDEAPFATGPRISQDGLHLLAAPVAPLQLGAAPVVSAAIPPTAGESGEQAGAAANGAAGSEDADLMSRATIRMAPLVALHQPIARRPTEKMLPSVIVDPPAPPPAPEPSVVVAAPVPAARPLTHTAPMVAVKAPAALRGPKTDPAISRTRQTVRRAPRESDAAAMPAYEVPRSRTPIVAVSVGIGIVALALGIYFVNAGSSAPPEVISRPASPQPTVTTPPIPPPAEETTAAAPPQPPAPPPATAAPPPPSIPTVAVATLPTAPAPTATTPPSRPSGPRWTPMTRPTKPPPSKNTPATPAPGAIVRDNPF